VIQLLKINILRGGSNFMKKLSGIAVLIVLTLLIISATSSKALTDQQIHKMIDEGFSESNNIILHKEKVVNGLVVFYGEYEINNSLGVRFMKKKWFGWQATYDRGAGGFGGPLNNIHGIYIPKMDKKSPFPILLGIITNSEIAQIEVEYRYKNDFKKIKAKTIQGKDRYVWFAFVDEPKRETIYKIKGYSSNGDLVETTKKESIHLPKN
jgi:hypothetical protein